MLRDIVRREEGWLKRRKNHRDVRISRSYYCRV